MRRGLGPGRGPDPAADPGGAPAAAEGQAAVPSEPNEPGDGNDGRGQPVRPGLFDDIPRSIWAAFLAGWAGFFLLMWAFFANGPDARFMVTIVILFGVMAFGLPIVMARQTKCGPRARCDMVDTRTGPVSVRAAAAQIALIPGAVVIGLLGFILFAKL
jgi:hypothetical protein